MGDAWVDHRFLLANERTFLAYIRTALALQLAGLAVLQFFTQGHHVLRLVLGVLLVAVGSFVGVAGLLRYRRNDRSIREGEELHANRAASPIAAAVVIIPLAAAILLTLV